MIFPYKILKIKEINKNMSKNFDRTIKRKRNKLNETEIFI